MKNGQILINTLVSTAGEILLSAERIMKHKRKTKEIVEIMHRQREVKVKDNEAYKVLRK